jgi:hypothetical protein
MSTKRFVVPVIVVALALLWPAAALAQRGRGAPPPGRGGGRVAPPVRSAQRVTIGVGWGYGPWGPYGGWAYGYGPWGPWGPWGYGGGPYYGYDYMYSQARIQVQPKEAEVFVDGYRAGTVDDFDGFFQRLNVWPGEHQITLYLEGYVTENHLLYMAPSTTANLKGTMEKLPDGVKSEPPPQPAPPANPPPRAARAEPQNPPPAAAQPTVEVRQAPVRFGGLAIRVMPADAEVLIDDQSWPGPGEDQRLNVQIAAGRHHVEVRKEGYVTYQEDVLIRAGATMTLNVSLTKK